MRFSSSALLRSSLGTLVEIYFFRVSFTVRAISVFWCRIRSKIAGKKSFTLPLPLTACEALSLSRTEHVESISSISEVEKKIPLFPPPHRYVSRWSHQWKFSDSPWQKIPFHSIPKLFAMSIKLFARRSTSSEHRKTPSAKKPLHIAHLSP